MNTSVFFRSRSLLRTQTALPARNRRFRAHVSAFCWCILSAAAPLVLTAQTNTSITDSVSPPAVGAGAPVGSYALSGLDTVNLYSGSNYIRIPLYQVGGRGSVTYPLSLELQNKWTIHGNANNGSQVLSVSSAGVGGLSPWDPLVYGVVTRRETISDNPPLTSDPCVSPGLPATGYTFFVSPVATTLTYVDPNGSEHTLIDTRYNGQPLLPNPTPNCQTSPSAGTDRGPTFRANDSSNIVFTADADVVDQIAFISKTGPGPMQHAMSGWLQFPDGHKQRVDSGPRASWKIATAIKSHSTTAS